MKKDFIFNIFLVLALFVAFYSPGLAKPIVHNCQLDAEQNKNVVIHKIESFSKKANVVFVRHYLNGKPGILELLKLTDKTDITGFSSPSEYAKDEVVFFEFEVVDGEKVATKFGKNNAEIEAGIKNLSVRDLQEILQSDQKIMLIDSRPTAAYQRDHIPGAVSIPVKSLQEKGFELLPQHKDIQLVFYCGGFS